MGGCGNMNQCQHSIKTMWSEPSIISIFPLYFFIFNNGTFFITICTDVIEYSSENCVVHWFSWTADEKIPSFSLTSVHVKNV